MRAIDSVICPRIEKGCEFVSSQQQISDRLQKMIEYSAIFFSNPLTFNDPFDAHFSIETEDENEWQDIKDKFEKVGKQLIREGKCTEERFNNLEKHLETQLPLENYKVSCFSGDGNNELMWAHYADQHRGVVLCYEFDSIENIIQKRNDNWVFIDKGSFDSYSTDNHEYSILLDYVKYSFGKQKMKVKNGCLAESYSLSEVLFTKSINWSYEKEIRLALQIPMADRFNDGNHYIILDKHCLKSIVFGERLDDIYRNEIINLINRTGYENVK